MSFDWRKFVLINILVFVFLLFQCHADENKKCNIPSTAPKRLEEVMGICEEEIKYAILAEALKLFNIKNDEIKTKQKRSVLSQNEKRVAGCLLQCVYQKMKAVDEKGYPLAKGLIDIYTEGIKQKEYVEANVLAVNKCLTKSLAEESNICITAYNTFNCISDEVAKYCGQTP